MFVRYIFFTFFLLIAVWLPQNSYAIPNLQIYSPEDGVYYDTDSETWIIPYSNYELWVVGAQREVYDVKLGLAVPTDEDGSITIDGNVLTEDLVIDWPGPYTGTGSFFIENGTPLMGDGSEVPGGGVFPSSYYQYYLGDFGLGETVHNYIPGDEYMDTASGEIKKLSIQISGYSWVDIIAYDHVIFSNNKAKFVKTPYSHDGGGGIPIAEPATMILLGSGLICLGGLGKGMVAPKDK